MTQKTVVNQNQKKPRKNSGVVYNSNPFSLAFNAFGRLFDKNIGWVIAFLFIGFITAAGQLGNGADMSANSSSQNEEFERIINRLSDLSPEQISVLVVGFLIMLLFAIVISIVIIAIQSFIGGMFAYVALGSEKGKKVAFNDAFEATRKRFWRLFLAQILAGIKIFLWTLLLIIPGIIAALRYILLTYVIMDEPADKKGVIASHTKVKSLVKGRLIEVLGLVAAANLIPIIGGVLQLSGGASQYHQLKTTYNNGKPERPPIHWLNYVAPLLYVALAALLLFVFFGLFLVLLSLSAL